MTICLLMCSRKRKSRSGPNKAPNLPNGLWQLKAHIAYEYYIIMYFYLLPYYFIYLEVQKQVLYICFSHSVLMSFYHKGHHHLICLALFSWFWKLEESCWLKPISHSSQIFMQKSFLLPASRQDVFSGKRQKKKERKKRHFHDTCYLNVHSYLREEPVFTYTRSDISHMYAMLKVHHKR